MIQRSSLSFGTPIGTEDRKLTGRLRIFRWCLEVVKLQATFTLVVRVQHVNGWTRDQQ
jgi:hypothetical protein